MQRLALVLCQRRPGKCAVIGKAIGVGDCQADDGMDGHRVSFAFFWRLYGRAGWGAMVGWLEAQGGFLEPELALKTVSSSVTCLETILFFARGYTCTLWVYQMEVDWGHSRCIVCLKAGQLTKEHVILASLGGILTSPFLCRTCNSDFGAGFEAKARLSPELRRAASGLGKCLSELKEKLDRGALYTSEFGEQTSRQTLGKDGQMRVSKLGDGSLIVPERDTPRHLASIMKKHGASETDIASIVARWEAAPAGRKVDIGAGLVIWKWQYHPATPAYAEPPLSPLVPLKIAFEFAALMVGGAIYRSEFQHIRQVLLNQDSDLGGAMVSCSWASKPDAFHGIAFQGNHEVAQFQVRLFGLLAYTVRLAKIAIQHPEVVYTHNLETGKDWVRIADE